MDIVNSHQNIYRKLPGRNVINSPFNEKSSVSYGIIAYALDTSRWFLIKRRHSPEFIIIIRGSYRLSHLHKLLSGITIDEKNKLNKCLDGQLNFTELYKMVLYYREKDLNHAEIRFNECKSDIQILIKRIQPKLDTEWLWPKGHLMKGIIREHPHQCAIREFEEESGMKLTNQLCLSNYPLIENYKGSDGRTYETHLFVYIFEHEEPFEPVGNLDEPGEIGDRQWASKKMALELLSPTKINILYSVEQLINQKFF